MRLILAACLLLLAGPVAPNPPRGAAPTTGPTPSHGEIARLVRSGTPARYCGTIGFVDLGSATDGPAYFFRRGDGQVLGRCGGYCRGPDARERCRRECPPRGWSCR